MFFSFDLPTVLLEFEECDVSNIPMPDPETKKKKKVKKAKKKKDKDGESPGYRNKE